MSGALVRVILNLLLAYVTFNPFIPALCSFKKNSINKYLQPIITQYFIDNKSEIWLLFLIAHSKR